MTDLVGNPEDRFSHNGAHIIKLGFTEELYTLFFLTALKHKIVSTRVSSRNKKKEDSTIFHLKIVKTSHFIHLCVLT